MVHPLTIRMTRSNSLKPSKLMNYEIKNKKLWLQEKYKKVKNK